MALTDKLTAIADAIRGKTGESGTLTLDAMAAAIAGIEAGGGGDIAMGTFVAAVDTTCTDSSVGASSRKPIYTINHGLGFIPKYMVMFAYEMDAVGNQAGVAYQLQAEIAVARPNSSGYVDAYHYLTVYNSYGTKASNSGTFPYASSADAQEYWTAERVCVTVPDTSTVLPAGATYHYAVFGRFGE